jgi:uncharacterized small protein (DUF1192 family)
MDEDDREPRSNANPFRNLEDMSLEALRQYIGELEAEIERVRAAIRDKEKARTGAQDLFRR